MPRPKALMLSLRARSSSRTKLPCRHDSQKIWLMPIWTPRILYNNKRTKQALKFARTLKTSNRAPNEGSETQKRHSLMKSTRSLRLTLTSPSTTPSSMVTPMVNNMTSSKACQRTRLRRKMTATTKTTWPSTDTTQGSSTTKAISQTRSRRIESWKPKRTKPGLHQRKGGRSWISSRLWPRTRASQTLRSQKSKITQMNST